MTLFFKFRPSKSQPGEDDEEDEDENVAATLAFIRFQAKMATI